MSVVFTSYGRTIPPLPWLPHLCPWLVGMIDEIFPELKSNTGVETWKWGGETTDPNKPILVIEIQKHPLILLVLQFRNLERVCKAAVAIKRGTVTVKHHQYELTVDDEDSYVGWLSLVRSRTRDIFPVYRNTKRISLWCAHTNGTVRLENGILFTWDSATGTVQVLQPADPSDRLPLGSPLYITSAKDHKYFTNGQFVATNF